MRWTIHARLLVGSLIAIPSARPDDAAPAWELRLEDGATAVLARDNDGTRVARTNALGRVHLVWSSPIATETDGTVQLNLPYRADDASVANLLLLRATARPDDTPRLEGDSQAFAVWTGQSLVRNMPAGRWDTRLATARAKAGGSLTIHAILAGNPGTTWLGTPTVEPLPIVRPLYEPYDDPFTEEQVREALEKRPVGTAHAADHNGRKALFVEGRPVPAVIHKALGANDSRGDFAGFAGAGIHLTTAAISTGDTGAGRSDRDEPIWLGRDRFALDRIDAALLRVLRRDPEARIILDVRVEPYKDWGREHPDEIVRDAEGRRAYGPCSYVGQYTDDAGLIDAPGSGKWWYPSWQSEVWRGDLEHVFEKVAAHVKTSPYGKAVVGFFVTGRDDGQFVVHYNDHSNPTERSFRSYLESRYKTIDRLNAAWKTAHPSFESITVPAQSWDSGRTHYEPGPEPEFRAFRARDPWAVRDRLAAALKRGIGRPAVVLAYAAPYHPAFADCAYLDGVGMQPDYAHRRPSFSVAYNPVSADDVGDRLLFTELDLRTPRGEGWPTTPPYLAWVSAASSIDEFTQVHRKITGISLANGYGDWYYDMGQYFRDPALHDEIATVKDVRARPVPPRRLRRDRGGRPPLPHDRRGGHPARRGQLPPAMAGPRRLRRAVRTALPAGHPESARTPAVQGLRVS
jgi:hypothetical protein